MKKTLGIVMIIVMLLFILTACGEGSTVNNNTTEVEDMETTIAPETKVAYPLTITDYSGEKLTFPKKPERIISLTLATDEILVELVDRARIQALEIYADDPGLSNIVEIAKTFPVKLNAEIEKIIDLQPDLVFVADWKEKEFVQQLKDANIPVFIFKAPVSFDELNKAITDIATLTDEVEKGKAMIEGINTKLKDIAEKINTIKPEDKLTVLDYSFYGTTYGKGTSFDELVTKAGLINAAVKAGMTEPWPAVSKEQVIEMDPDIIFLHAWSYDKNTDPQKFAEDFKNDKSFSSLKAVKNNRVYILQDKHTTNNSQNMVLGVEDMAKAAYPELFK